MIRHGKAPYLECSTKGDRRFSAFCARIKARGNKSIEELYQGAKKFDDGPGTRDWKLAIGRVPLNIAEVHQLYSRLWDEYIAENPHLIYVICEASGLSDMFGRPGHACQATELWRIREEYNL